MTVSVMNEHATKAETEMTTRKLLLLTGLAAILVAPAASVRADPWKDESGHSRGWERHERGHDREHDRDWSDRRRWEHDRHAERDWDRDRRAEYDRRRAYEQGREDAYWPGPRGPLAGPAEILGQVLGR